MKQYYNKKFKPNYHKLEEIDINVIRLLAPNPSPFTFYGTGTYIIGKNELAIIDPGPNIGSHIEIMLKIINKKTLVHLFITHTHADHSPAAKIIKEKTRSITYGYGAYPKERYESQFEEGHDLDFKPDIKLKDGDIVKGPDWTIRAIHTPGHTSNHMCYGLEENSILFTGDHIMGWSTTVIIPPDGDMTAYMNSLRKLLSLNYKVYYPTHGSPIKEPKKFVKALIAHRKMREYQILKELFNKSQSIKEMVSKFYKTTDKRLWPAAEKSILATLISLENRGKVTTLGGKNTRWKLTSK